MATQINTIGYEGASLDDFVDTLRHVGVETLIDVRERAQSRRRGFSKTALSQALEDAGIGYLHLRELGDPKDGRDAARAGDWEKFDRIYRSVLASAEARAAISEIADRAAKGSVCLLCYERDPRTCHRSYVADAVSRLVDSQIVHLGVQHFGVAAE